MAAQELYNHRDRHYRAGLVNNRYIGRTFIMPSQGARQNSVRRKLNPIRLEFEGKDVLLVDDSIVRGTQLQDVIQRLFDSGAREVHMRPACPPLVCGFKFLNFSRSKSELDLAGRRAIRELEPGVADPDLGTYADASTPEYAAMLEQIRDRLGLTTLAYQHLGDLVEAIGLPKEDVCTYCWDSAE